MAQQEQRTEIDLVSSDELVGRRARLVGAPDVVGVIVRLIYYPCRRCPVLSYWWDGNMTEVVCESFQVELVE